MGATARCALAPEAAARLLAVHVPSRSELKGRRGELARILYGGRGGGEPRRVVQRLEQIGAFSRFRRWTPP